MTCSSLTDVLARLRLHHARTLLDAVLVDQVSPSADARHAVQQALAAYQALCRVSRVPRPGLSALVSMIHRPRGLAALMQAMPELQAARYSAVAARLQEEREACHEAATDWRERYLRLRALARCLQRSGRQDESHFLCPARARLQERRDLLIDWLLDWLQGMSMGDAVDQSAAAGPAPADMAHGCDALLRLERLLYFSEWQGLAAQVNAGHVSLLLASLHQQALPWQALQSGLLQLSLQVQARVPESLNARQPACLLAPEAEAGLVGLVRKDLKAALRDCRRWLQQGDKVDEAAVLASYRLQRVLRTVQGGPVGALAEAWHALLLWHWQEGLSVQASLRPLLSVSLDRLGRTGDLSSPTCLQLRLLLCRLRLQWRQSAHRPFAGRSGQLPETALPMLLATGLDAVMQPLAGLEILMSRQEADPALMCSLSVLARGAAALRLAVIGQLAEQLVEAWQWLSHGSPGQEEVPTTEPAQLLRQAHQALQYQINQAAAWHAAPPGEEVLLALSAWNVRQRQAMAGIGLAERYSPVDLLSLCRGFMLKLRALLQVELHAFCQLQADAAGLCYPGALGSALQQLLSFLLLERLESPEQRQRRSRTASSWLWLTLVAETDGLSVQVKCDALPGPLSSRRLARLGQRLPGPLQAEKGEMPNGARGWIYRWHWKRGMAL